MPYKLTFKDGSDGYLEHFGVKGMHWGVWNEETRARRIGGSKRNKPTVDSKIFEKAYNERIRKTSNAMSNDPEIRKSLNKVTSYEKRYGLNFEDPEFSWTSKSQAVRKGYSKVHNKYTNLQKQKHKAYTKKYKDEVYSKYIKKYGKTTFKKSKRKYQREGAAAIAKLSAIVLTAPISVPIIVAKEVHESKKNNKSSN